MITHKVEVAVPGCDVAGFVYAADVPEELGEDMLDLSLPNGVLVTAGWYPEGDPDGQYRVSVYDRSELVVSLWSREVEQAAKDVRHLAAMILSGGLSSIANAIRAGA
jgi:hypothetical protein